MKKILAIDDNELNLELLNHLVRKYYPDFKFLKSLSGYEGIEIAKNEDPDLILLDILMPEINGYEVCKILKEKPKTANIPVMMISALGWKSEERIKGLDAGADAFISKPFDNNELRAQINVALRIKAVEDLLRQRNENLELSIKSQTNKYLQREERVLQISEHVKQFYWETDEKGTIVYVSPVIENILKIPPLDIIGKMNYRELFQLNEEDSPIQLSKDSIIKEVEISLVVDESKMWLAFSSFPYFNRNEEYNGNRGVCYDITNRKLAEIEQLKNIRKIERYQKKLKVLNREISLVEERERRIIAENLHDGLGQTLSLAFIKLSSIDTDQVSPAIKNTIETTSDLINRAINESRSLTYDLSPPILYELGLIPALKWKLEQVEQKYDLKTTIIGEDNEINFKKEYSIFVYRIIGELIQNIIKHANATNVILRISKTNEKYIFELEDNGVGIDEEKSKKNKISGFGLMSIKEKLESFNGQFHIKSEKGKGTKAIIEVTI